MRRHHLERTGEDRPRSGSRADLVPGDEVKINGGLFAGRTGVIEDVLPSGKLRVRVRSLRTHASARVDPAFVEPLGISIEPVQEQTDDDARPRALE